MKTSHISLLIIVNILYITSQTVAQDSTQSKATAQIWSVFYLSSNLGLIDGNITIEYDKEIIGDNNYYSLSIEPGIEYYLYTIDLFTNLYVDYTQQQPDQTTTELRPIFGARWNIIKPENRFYLRFIPQAEYRFFFSHNTQTSKDALRLRFAVDNRYSFNQKSYNAINNIYLVTKFEYFLNLTKNINETFTHQYRAYIALGYKLDNKWKFEAYYINQGSQNNKKEDSPASIENIIKIQVNRRILKKTNRNE